MVRKGQGQGAETDVVTSNTLVESGVALGLAHAECLDIVLPGELNQEAPGRELSPTERIGKTVPGEENTHGVSPERLGIVSPLT